MDESLYNGWGSELTQFILWLNVLNEIKSRPKKMEGCNERIRQLKSSENEDLPHREKNDNS